MADERATNAAATKRKNFAQDASPIDGLSFVDDSKLHAEFQRLKGNKMYFVDHCIFFGRNNQPGGNRIFALTQNAFFVIDSCGTMDRATPYESVTFIYYKRTKEKKILAFNSYVYHILLKIPNETDLHIGFLHENVARSCLFVLTRLLQVQTGDSSFCPKEVPHDKNIEYYCNDAPPGDYHNPREILEINKQRDFYKKYLGIVKEHIANLLNSVEDTTARVTEREEEIEKLKSKGVDEGSIRQRSKILLEEHERLRQQMAKKHEECERVLETIRQLQETLLDMRSNMNALVETDVEAAMAVENKNNENITQLRRRAQQKEKTSVMDTINGYKSELHALYENSSVPKVKEAWAQFASAFAALERELGILYRHEKFLCTVNAELQMHNDLILAKNLEKQELIAKIERGGMGASPAGITANEDILLGDVLFTASSSNKEEDPLASADFDLL